jgi:heptosyltransferase-3
MQKILILRGGALGDFIVTLPALAALRAVWPDARIELAGNAPAAALAVNRGLLDAAHSQHESRWSALYAPAPLPPAFSAYLASFDLILNFWPDPDGDLARHFPLHSAQRFLTAPALPTRAPAAAHYCAPLHALGLTPTAFFHPLAPFRSDRSTLIPQLSTSSGSPFSFALHPGSGSPKKNWPLAHWLALIPQLPGPLLIILGEAELPAWSAFLSTPLVSGLSMHHVGPNVVTLAINLPLEDLVTLLHRSRRFLGHDSGISHLAAACGVPSLLLFGPTNSAIWAPPAPHVRVLQHPAGLSTLSLSEVLTRL